MNTESIPFKVPDTFISSIKTGAAKRIGANIVDRASGRILGHVQETAAFPIPKVSVGGGPASLVLGGVQTASSVASNIQLEQVKSMLSGLKMLNQATLGASLLGVGVSVAGFAIMNRKLDRISASLKEIEKETKQIKEDTTELLAWNTASRSGAIRSQLKKAEEAWLWRDAAAAIELRRDLLSSLHDMDEVFRCYLLSDGGINAFTQTKSSLDLCLSAYDAVNMAVWERFQLLLILNEYDAAVAYSQQFFEWHQQLIMGISTNKVLRAKFPDSEEERLKNRKDFNNFFDGALELNALASTRKDVATTLSAKGIDGLSYVKALREEKHAPVLLLSAET